MLPATLSSSLATLLLLLAAASSLSIMDPSFRAEGLTRLSQETGGQAAYNRTGSASPLRDPPQCNKYPCPPSKVLDDRGSYKVVYFPVAPYAKSRLEGQTMIPATMKLYKRLYGYMNGENNQKETLKRTAPVILRMDPNDQDGVLSPKNFTLFFFLDGDVSDMPTPNDDTVEVLDVNSYVLYIRTFSGYPITYGDWMRELLQLVADVQADGQKYVTGYYYFASYDPPSQTTGRINEVQLLRPHPKGYPTGL